MPPIVTVIRPDITEEERQKRIDHLAETMSMLFKCKVTIRKKDECKAADPEQK